MDLGSAHGRIEFLYDPNGVAHAKSDLESLGKTGNNIDQQLTKVGGAMLGIGGAISAGVGIATGAAANFEEQLSNIASVGGKEAVDRMEEIRKTALQLGMDTSFSTEEAAQGMEAMIKAGIPLTDVLEGAAEAGLALSAATGTPVVESAELMSTALNVFSDSMTEFTTEEEKATHVADLFTQVANATATDVHDLGLAFQQSAAVGKLFGLSVDETATSLGVLADAGIKGSDAGTSLKTMLLSLTRQTKPANAELHALGLTFDDFYDSTGQFVGIEQMFNTFRTAMAKAGYTAQDTQDAFAQIFGQDAIRAASVFFDTTDKGWNETRDNMDKVGTASEQAAIRLDNFKGAAEKLGGSINAALIAFGTPLLGSMRKTAEGLTEIVNGFTSLDPHFQEIISKGVALTGTLLGIGGSALIAAGYFVKLAKAVGISQSAALKFVGAFGVIGTLAALAVGAYATNFLGFGDAVRSAMAKANSAIKTFGATFSKSFSKAQAKGLNTFSAGVKSFGKALKEATGIDITGFTGPIAEAVERGVTVFQSWIDDGFSPVASALAGISHGFDELADRTGNPVFRALTGIFADLTRFSVSFGNALETNLRVLGDRGWESISRAILAFGAALDSVTGIPIYDYVERLAGVINLAEKRFHAATDNGLNPFLAGIEGLKGAFESIFGIDIDGFSRSLGELGSSLRDVASSLLQGDFDTAFDTLGAGIRGAVDQLGPALTNALGNLGSAIRSIDIGQIVVNIAGWVQGKWDDLKSWIQERILSRLPSVNLGQVVANVGSWLVEQKEKLPDVIATTVERAKTALGAAGVLIGQIIATIQKWVVTDGANIVESIKLKAIEIVNAASGVDLPQIAANVIKWVVNIVDDLGAAINTALLGGGTTSQAHGADAGPGGGSGFSVDIPLVVANILKIIGNITGAIGTFLLDLGTAIYDAAQAVDVVSVTASIRNVFWDIKTAMSNALIDLVADITKAVTGAIITVEDGPDVTVKKVNIKTDAADNPVKQAFDWALGTKDDVNTEINRVFEDDSLGQALSVVNYGVSVGNAMGDAFDEIATSLYEGSNKVSPAFNNFMGVMDDGAAKMLKQSAVIIGGIGLFGTGIALGWVGFEGQVQDGLEHAQAAANDMANFFKGIPGGTEAGIASGVGFGAAAPVPDPFNILATTTITVQNMGTMIDTISTETNKVVPALQKAFADIQAGTLTIPNPFEALMTKIQQWGAFLMKGFDNLTANSMGGPGERGEIGTLSGGLGAKIARDLQTMIDGIEPAIKAVLPTDNPLQPAINKIGEWWEQLVSFDFGGLRVQGADAAALGEGQFDAAAVGLEMGTSMAETFGSEDFIAGVQQGLESVPLQQFVGVGVALMTKINQGLAAALTLGSQSSTSEGAPSDLSTKMSITLKEIFTSMVAPLTAAANELDIGVFAPVGAALMAKIQEGLTAALAGPGAGGGTGAVGITPAPAGMAEGVISSIVNALTGAVATANFTPFGTAFSTGLGTALTTAMTTAGTQIATGTTQWAAEFINAFNNIQTVVTNGMITVANAVTTGTGTVGTAFSTGGIAWFTEVGNAFTNMQTAVSNGMISMSNAVTAGTSNINVILSTAGTTWFGTISNAVTNMMTALNNFTTSASTAGTSAGTGFSDGLSAGMAAAQGAVESILTTIIGIMEAARGRAFSAGASIGQGLADGIASAQGEVAAAADALVAEADRAVAAKAEISSPSKLFYGRGESMGQGLVNGISDAIQPMVARVGDIITQANFEWKNRSLQAWKEWGSEISDITKRAFLDGQITLESIISALEGHQIGREFNNSIQSIVPTLKEMSSSGIVEVNKLNEAIATLRSEDDFGKTASGFYSSMADSLAALFPAAEQAAKGVEVIQDSLKAAVTNPEFLDQLRAGELGSQINEAFDNFGSNYQAVLSQFTGDTSVAMDYFAGIFATGMDQGNDALVGFSDSWKKVGGEGGPIYQAAHAIGDSLVDGTFQGIDELKASLSPEMQAVFIPALQAVEKMLGGTFDRLLGGVDQVSNEFGTKGAEAANNFGTALSSGMTEAGNSAGNALKDSIAPWVEEVKGLMTGWNPWLESQDKETRDMFRSMRENGQLDWQSRLGFMNNKDFAGLDTTQIQQAIDAMQQTQQSNQNVISSMAADRQLMAQIATRQQPIQIQVTSELDGQVLADTILDTVYSPLQQTVDRRAGGGTRDRVGL